MFLFDSHCFLSPFAMSASVQPAHSDLTISECEEEATERHHVQGLGTDGGGQGAEPFAAPPDVGREWLRKIQSSF